MQHNAAFCLGLHCMQKYSFRSVPNIEGKNVDLAVKVTHPSEDPDEILQNIAFYQSLHCLLR